jgi:hypothetical protein
MIWGLLNEERISASPNVKGVVCEICRTELITKCGVVKSWHFAHKSNKDCDDWYEPESEWHLKWKNEFTKDEQEVIIENHRADIKCKGIIIELQNSSISPDDICDREKFYGNMIWLLNGETLAKNIELRSKTEYISFSWKNPPQSWFYSDKKSYIDLTQKVTELKENIFDTQEKLGIVYNKLKELIGANPNEFDFNEYKYSFKNKTEHDSEVLKFYNEWCVLSEKLRELHKQDIIFNGQEIFMIKKLYKNIPCGGWGYLISKEDFLKRLKGEDNGKG